MYLGFSLGLLPGLEILIGVTVKEYDSALTAESEALGMGRGNKAKYSPLSVLCTTLVLPRP